MVRVVTAFSCFIDQRIAARQHVPGRGHDRPEYGFLDFIRIDVGCEKLAVDHHIHLLFSLMNLQLDTGFTAAAAIKKDTATQQLAIVAVSRATYLFLLSNRYPDRSRLVVRDQ